MSRRLDSRKRDCATSGTSVNALDLGPDGEGIGLFRDISRCVWSLNPGVRNGRLETLVRTRERKRKKESATQNTTLAEEQMGFYDWDRMKPEEVTDLYLRKVVAGKSIAVARIEVKEGAVTLPHNHDSEEVIIVLSGAWRFQLSGRDVTLSANQMLCIPPGS
jgi:quercetin dioxygenase-like cupin family protein